MTAFLSLIAAGMLGMVLWPEIPEVSVYELSRADGISRFYATTFSKTVAQPNRSLLRRLEHTWTEYQRRNGKRNPAGFVFARQAVQRRGIQEMLSQCMEITGTRYLIAVEIAGAVEFGHSNVLNGTQWVAACEQAIESSTAIVCYDYAKKSNFEDTLVIVRDTPGVVKVLPRTKLRDYQEAGLIDLGQ